MEPNERNPDEAGELNLSDQNLESLPGEVVDLPCLKHLDL